MSKKVMTFNLRVDVPSDGDNVWANRIEKVAKTINENQPLVVGTQEGLLRMIEDMEGHLPEYRWIGEGRHGGLKDEFCAIFYQASLVECVGSGQFWLSEQPEVPGSISWESDFPRICTWGQFRLKDNPEKSFLVYNTHLDHISQSARENGIALVWEKLSKHAKEKQLPVLLTGDFNSEPDNVVVQFLRGRVAINQMKAELLDAYRDMERAPGTTFHNFKGGIEGEPIDYIFGTADVTFRHTEVDRRKVNNGYPSDHYPVIAEIEL